MAIQMFEAAYDVLPADELAAWRAIPPAVASDCMNRTQVMHAAIKPISESLTLCGQARTVSTMVGDSGPICALIDRVQPGEVIVVDGGAAENVAVWGGIMTEASLHRQVGGAVIDGAIRDVADLRRANFAMFCRAIVPRGPHHGFGGFIDGTVSVGGVPVRPGDIVLGNSDGVVVVPLEWASTVLQAAQAHLLKEADWIKALRNGETIEGLFGMPAPQLAPGVSSALRLRVFHSAHK